MNSQKSEPTRVDLKGLSQSELMLMNYYVEKVRNINDSVFSKTGHRPLAHIITFGCQMNAHDSETLAGLILQMGYEISESDKTADLLLHNTCCVRENAENRVYGNLGFLKHAKAQNKNLKIVLCGCMMQQDTVIDKIKKTYRHVDIIFGTFNLHRFPQLLYTNLETEEMIIDIWKEHSEIIEDLPVVREYNFKAAVNIMYGCNNFCSYCIVPYVRGRERSRSPQDILTEIRKSVLEGAKEILLLGQNVNSYSFNDNDELINFPKLLRMVNEVEGLEQIRFMTSHPKDLSEELIYAMRDLNKVCKQLHLPLQSGSSEILGRMNRYYTKESYLFLIERIKKEIPDIAITTDLIVGFPGETEEDFLETIDVIKKVGFSAAFTFIYSKRTGTPAANMENQIDEKVIKDRFERLLSTLTPIIYEINRTKVGQTLKVLAEDRSKQNPEYISARTESNTIVHFKGNESVIGEFVNVKIVDCKTFYLSGEMV